MSQQVIVVVGAAGLQGGAVVDGLIKAGKYSVRAITRNPDSDKGKALKQKCGDLVKADLDDVESLKKAFEGAYGAFIVTNYWEHFNCEKEIQQAKNAADAAKAAGLQHVVLSSLEDTRKIVKEGTMPKMHDGRYYVPEFDGKGEIQEYVMQTIPTTVILACCYYENFITYKMSPRPGPDGVLGITFPSGYVPMPLIYMPDFGKYAAKLFEDKNYIGQIHGVVSDILTIQEVADIFAKVIGKKVVYHAVEPSEYAKFPIPGAEDLASIFQYMRDYVDALTERRDWAKSRKLVPDLLSFEDYVHAHKEEIIAISLE